MATSTPSFQPSPAPYSIGGATWVFSTDGTPNAVHELDRDQYLKLSDFYKGEKCFIGTISFYLKIHIFNPFLVFHRTQKRHVFSQNLFFAQNSYTIQFQCMLLQPHTSK